MAQHDDVIKQYLASFSNEGAGIDLDKFRTDFLPQAPTPPTTTLQDPSVNRGNALAVFGAGLAQPIGFKESFSGNTANAALAGLDVLGQQRTQENEAAKVLFNQQISTAQLQREQGTALTNAAMANAQREYYQGLIVNAGLEHLLTADEAQNTIMLDAMKQAVTLTKTLLETLPDLGFSEEELDSIFITPDQLLTDVYLNILDNLGVEDAPAQVMRERIAAIAEEVDYLGIRKLGKDVGIDLPDDPRKFLAKREFWESEINDAVEARRPGGKGSLTGSVAAADTALAEIASTTQTAGELESLVDEAVAFTSDIEPTVTNVRAVQALSDKLANTFPDGNSLAKLTAAQQQAVRDAFNDMHQFLKNNEGLQFNKGGFSRLNPPPTSSVSSTPNPSTTGVATRFNR